MREKIIKSAFELFLQRGIRSVTMDDIAKQMGMSKRTIYEIFKDKHELLECAIDLHQQEGRQKISKIINETPSCITGILSVVKSVFDSKMLEYKPAEIFIHDMKKYFPDLIERVRKYRREYLMLLAQYLKKGVKQGTVRNDLNLNLIAELLIVQIEGWDIMHDIEKAYKPSEILQTMTLSFCRGISTETGLKEIDAFLQTHKFEN